MTTFSITGVTVLFEDNEEFEAEPSALLQDTEFTLFLPADASPTFSYENSEAGEDETPVAVITADDNIHTAVNGAGLGLTEEFFLEVSWRAGGKSKSAQLFGFDEMEYDAFGELVYANRLHLFQIGGDELSAFDSLEDWLAFNAAIEDGDYELAPLSGDFGPGAEIAFDDIFPDSSEDDFVVGSDYNDDILTGAGDDTVHPGNNEDYDWVKTGTGDDRVVYTGVDHGFYELSFTDLDEGVEVNINGKKNRGVIDKGDNGTTRLVDVKDAFKAEGGGMHFYGTDHDDSFRVTPTNDSWLSIRGYAGDDHFVIGKSSSGVRLDYRHGDGLVADLGKKIIEDDGFGDTDTFAGKGRVTEIRATMGDDEITGSRHDDRFILMAGEDTLDGGRGFDLLRYNRTGVEAVEVNLARGEAAGSWRDEEFFHEFSSVEAVWGSSEGDDRLTGSRKANLLYGSGGDDTLKGGNGADTLDGGNGDDYLLGGRGRDVIAFSAGQDRVKGFKAGQDEVDLSYWSFAEENIFDFETLLDAGHIRQRRKTVEIRDDYGNKLSLLKTDLDDLDAGDFIF